jgi:hypothetical protein
MAYFRCGSGGGTLEYVALLANSSNTVNNGDIGVMYSYGRVGTLTNAELLERYDFGTVKIDIYRFTDSSTYYSKPSEGTCIRIF